MKRRLWIAAMSLFVLSVGNSAVLPAQRASGCAPLHCNNDSQCQFGCACITITGLSAGRCGST